MPNISPLIPGQKYMELNISQPAQREVFKSRSVGLLTKKNRSQGDN